MAHRKKKHGIARDAASAFVSKLARLQAPIPGREEILATAYVSDNIPEHMFAALRDKDIRVIDAARRDGWRLVRVYWETGQSALLLCPPGSNMPEPHMVIKAYEAHSSSGVGRPTLTGGML